MYFNTLQALERELAPVEERLRTLTDMAQQVAAANPTEGKAVRERQSEITALWENLKVATTALWLYAIVNSSILYPVGESS